MFKCQITNRTSKPLEKLQKVILATRNVDYNHYDDESEEEWMTSGTEIVKEVNACEEGVRIWNNFSDEQKANFVRLFRAA